MKRGRLAARSASDRVHGTPVDRQRITAQRVVGDALEHQRRHLALHFRIDRARGALFERLGGGDAPRPRLGLDVAEDISRRAELRIVEILDQIGERDSAMEKARGLIEVFAAAGAQPQLRLALKYLAAQAIPSRFADAVRTVRDFLAAEPLAEFQLG